MPKREPKTIQFKRCVVDVFARRLGPAWVEAGPANGLRLERSFPWGHGGVSLGMTYRGLPSTNVHLVYGLRVASLSPLLDRLLRADGYEPNGFFDVWQDSVNRPLRGKARTSSVQDYNHEDVEHVFDDLLAGAEDELIGFFARYGDLFELRKSFEEDDHTFFAIGRDSIIVAIDFALGDVEHLARYRAAALPPWRQKALDRDIAALGLSL